jgi:uncharacterized membrane protein
MSEQDRPVVYEILAFNFADQDAASQVARKIELAGALQGRDIVAQAVVEQDAKGKVHIHEPGKGGIGATLGAVGGGLLGLIGGPVGVLVWVVGGAALGGVAGKYLGQPISKGDLQEFGQTLQPGTSAFLLLLEAKDTEDVIQLMSGYSSDVIKLTVGEDLSGQIAAYVADEVSQSASEDND